jgi:hypothetical protein
MKGLHPNNGHAVALAVSLLAIIVGGCRNQSTALSNPFMAPDRVPPPSTRAIPPGTAQPYYPGDPLPATQSSAPPAAPAPVVAQQSPANPALAKSAESPVSVPSDNGQLRYPLPQPQPVAPAPQPSVAAAPLPPPPSIAVTPALAAPSVAPPATPNVPSPITQASYTETSASSTPAIQPPIDLAHGPWRQPQIPQSSTAPVIAQIAPPALTPPSGAAQQVAGPSMPVSIRAVPSTVPSVVTSEPPRIRFPSAITSPAPVSPGVPQTVQVTPLPSDLMRTATAPQAASTNSDGFRPRGIVR